jgi:hypothetical protein
VGDGAHTQRPRSAFAGGAACFSLARSVRRARRCRSCDHPSQVHRPLNSLRRTAVCLVLAGLACLSAACSQLVPRDADQFARNFIDTLRTQPPAVIEKFLDPQLTAMPTLADSLAAARRYLPTASPDTLTIQGASVFWSNHATTRQIRYEVRAGGQHALVLIVLTERDSVRRISGVRVWPEPPQPTKAGGGA